jgi:ABC-type nitrate/sulfonate/bicarbonate transport system substrate-binding protein
VTFTTNITGPQAVAALQAGAVAGAVVGPSVIVPVESLGFRNLGFLGDHLDYLSGGLATHEDTLRDRPALARAMVRAELKAHRYMQQQREGTIAYLARFSDTDPAEAAVSYDRYMGYLTRDGLSTPDRLARILEDQRQELGLERAPPMDEAFDLRLARQAAEELDRAGWRP